MSKQHTLSSLTLEPRTKIGTTASQALRRTGKVPGVVYGHGEATPISVDAKQLAELILSGNKSRIVDATIGQVRDSVLLRRIEADPLTRKPLSVDFQRVTRDEAITSNVTVVTAGTPIGVRDQGGVMEVVAHTLEIKGPADSIPDNVTIDVTELGVHAHILAGDVKLPPGFTLITPADTVVVSVEITRALASEEAPAATGEAAPATETPAS
ncbi:MAG: large subunit ribosomal protein [Candidatus Eremiobacteraeota bacterium]|jgi:large subunit ribosomal protein L25|nr:large subunit ribosomal protein [Candidatus Eremiobacteraeota bacterium]